MYLPADWHKDQLVGEGLPQGTPVLRRSKRPVLPDRLYRSWPLAVRQMLEQSDSEEDAGDGDAGGSVEGSEASGSKVGGEEEEEDAGGEEEEEDEEGGYLLETPQSRKMRAKIKSASKEGELADELDSTILRTRYAGWLSEHEPDEEVKSASKDAELADLELDLEALRGEKDEEEMKTILEGNPLVSPPHMPTPLPLPRVARPRLIAPPSVKRYVQGPGGPQASSIPPPITPS